jgi:hypothetical protein
MFLATAPSRKKSQSGIIKRSRRALRKHLSISRAFGKEGQLRRRIACLAQTHTRIYQVGEENAEKDTNGVLLGVAGNATQSRVLVSPNTADQPQKGERTLMFEANAGSARLA